MDGLILPDPLSAVTLGLVLQMMKVQGNFLTFVLEEQLQM